MAPRKTTATPKRNVRTRATPMVITTSESSRSSSPMSSEGEASGKRVKVEPQATMSDPSSLVIPENRIILEAVEDTRLKQREFVQACLVLRYPFHSSRVYPSSWYDELDNLTEFGGILAHQGWKEFLEGSHVIYPVQLAQFWATLRIENRVLCSNFGDKQIKITMEEFGQAWGIPCEGVEIFSGGQWNGLEDEEQLAYKQFLDPEAKKADSVLLTKLSPLGRFLMNFMHATILPKKGGTQRVDAHENRVLYHLLNGDKVNLPLLIFSHISAVFAKLTAERTHSTLTIPYGMWLSKLLKIKGVVSKNTITRSPTDVMDNLLLRRMNMENIPVTHGPGQRKGKEKVGEASNMNEGVRMDVGRVKEYLDEFQAVVLSKFEALETKMMGKIDEVARKVDERGDVTIMADGGVGEKVGALVGELGKARDSILESLWSVDYKIGRIQDDIKGIKDDIAHIDTHGGQLSTNVGQVVELFQAHANPPSQRLAQIVDRLRHITERVDRTAYLLERNHRV